MFLHTAAEQKRTCVQLSLDSESEEMISCMAAIALMVALSMAQYASLAATPSPRVIIIGAGMSGKQLSILLMLLMVFFFQLDYLGPLGN